MGDELDKDAQELVDRTRITQDKCNRFAFGLGCKLGVSGVVITKEMALETLTYISDQVRSATTLRDAEYWLGRLRTLEFLWEDGCEI